MKTSRQAKTIPQLKDVVGKLGGLQSERQALVLRKSGLPELVNPPDSETDIGLAEMLVPMTNTEHFSKALEIQQSMCASNMVTVMVLNFLRRSPSIV